MEQIIKCDVFDVKEDYKLVMTSKVDINEDEPQDLVEFWSVLIFPNKLIEVSFYYPNDCLYTLCAYNGKIIYTIDEREGKMSSKEYFAIVEKNIKKLELCGLI